MPIVKTYQWIKSLLFIAGFCAYGYVGANHILGGDLSYSNTTGNKYKFTLKLYRNCNECEFNSGNCADIKTLDILVSREDLGYSKKAGSIALTLVGRKDITPICKSAKSSCAGGNYYHGIEEWTFEGSVDFDDLPKDYCRFEVGIKVESRLDAWSQSVSEPLYCFAVVNICSGIKNNSAVMASPAFHIVAQNQSFTYNPVATDADGDSLSYSLVKAEKGFASSITYPGTYTYQKPINVYCPSGCNLDNTSWPVEGIGIDPLTGWMGFTPVTSGQKGFVVIEIAEWRKIGGSMVKVGTTRRDLQIEVVDILNNAPKISTSKLTYYACTDETFNMDFSLRDDIYSGVKDSLGFKAWFDLPGFTLNKVGNAKNNFDGYFSYKFLKSQARSKPYYLTLAVSDDHCPQTITTYKTFEIYVVAAPTQDYTVRFKNCNIISCKSQINETNVQHSWFLYDAANLEETRNGLQTDFTVPKSGKWYVVHQALNFITGCMTEQRDSVIVPSFSLMKEKDNWPKKVCKNEKFALNASFTGGTAPFKYLWDNTSGADTHDYTLAADSTVQLFITDSSGCELSIKNNIGIFPQISIGLTDTALCMPSVKTLLKINNRYNAGGILPGSVSLDYSGNSGNITTASGELFFQPTLPAVNEFKLRFTDTNLCHNTRDFEIQVIQAVPTGILDDFKVCSNENLLNLDKASHCDLSNGYWKCPAKPLAVSGSTFYPKISGAGSFTLYYSKDLSGCLIRDTAVLLVNKSPIVQITKPGQSIFCENTPELYLKASPVGGNWQNLLNPSLKNAISPTGVINAGKTSNTITYTFTDIINQCSASDSFVFTVNKAPVLTLNSAESICSGEQIVLNPKAENAEKLELNGGSPQVTVSRFGDGWKMSSNGVEVKTIFNYTVELKALPGCENISRNFDLTVKPKPVLTLDASPDHGCSPLKSNVSAVNVNPKAVATNYEWNDGNAWGVKTSNRLITIGDSGIHAFKVRGILDGCTGDEVAVSVSVFSTPVAAFDIDPISQTVTQDYPSLVFTDKTLSETPYTRNWQFDRGTPASSDKASVNVAFSKDTGLYKVRLEAISPKGCSSVSETYIRVLPGLQFWVPNAFTPNGKGPDQNEVFRVNMDSTSAFHLTVRNRWGEILFKTDNQFESWDGTVEGKEVPNGTYFWIVEANTIYGRYLFRKGVVILIR